MPLRVYNTLTRQKEDFQPLVPGKVTMYVCGPTVYKPSHIGHMVGPVIFDTVKRYLQYAGFDVTWVVNITDVDDKLIRRAAELNTTVKELAEKMTADYVDCLKKLNVVGITKMPRATEHIDGMIDIMKGLIEKGYAYAAGGDVYFDVSRDEDYGKLCNRDPEQLEAGARIEVSEKKRNPGDFALWKGTKPGEPAWESPWGPGRPGWHIECSAMAMKLLGKTLDIHGGGLDLQFPHHENELAQSESFTGRPFSKYWMHNGLLRFRDKDGNVSKMAGSVGNVVNVVDLLAKFRAETVRFLLLSTHYRSPIEYSDDRLAELQKSLEGFHRFFERYQRITNKSFYELEAPMKRKEFEPGTPGSEFVVEVVKLWESFLSRMDDDFNTGGAVGVLYELLTALNRFVDTRGLEAGKGTPDDLRGFERGVLTLKEFSQILGVFEKPIEASAGGDDKLTAGLMQLLIDLRNQARKEKNFAVADQIRKRLTELNVTLEDRPGGTGWRVG
ncbi:MAG: cysteine--tRNA ligase [Gemmataceae bacterium]|nr:cysteine--tRNA ligase [Gemmataceae bacterium]